MLNLNLKISEYEPYFPCALFFFDSALSQQRCIFFVSARSSRLCLSLQPYRHHALTTMSRYFSSYFSRLCLSLHLFVLNTMAEFGSPCMTEFLPSAMVEWHGMASTMVATTFLARSCMVVLIITFSRLLQQPSLYSDMFRLLLFRACKRLWHVGYYSILLPCFS